MKPGPIPQPVTIAELERFHVEMTQIAVALGESIDAMKKNHADQLSIPGKVGMTQASKRATSFAKHARWAAFSSSKAVDKKLEEAEALLSRPKKKASKPKS